MGHKNEVRTRVREVDFNHIENNRNSRKLTGFEQEVKERLAASPSPFELLAMREERRYQKRKVQAARKQLKQLIHIANLGPKQKACLELYFIQGLSEKTLRRRLSLKPERVCELKQTTIDALKRAYQKSKKRQPQEDHNPLKLTDKQRVIWQLYYGKSVPLEVIAERLGISRRAVLDRLHRASKKMFL